MLCEFQLIILFLLELFTVDEISKEEQEIKLLSDEKTMLEIVIIFK